MIKRLAVVGFISVTSTLAVLGSVSATVHTIRKGDSLSSIARKYNVSYKDLAHANGLTDKSVLQLGQALKIPGAASAAHTSSATQTTSHPHVVALGVVARSAPMRSEPEASGKKVGTLPAGAKVKILQTKWHWHQVKTQSGTMGWVGDYLIRSTPVAQPQTTASRPAAPKKVATSSRRSPAHVAKSSSSKQYMGHVSKADRLAQAEPVQTATGAREAEPGSMAVLRTAMAQRGSRYRYGGVSRGGFDCSGFTRWVYAKHGVALPHNAAAQSRTGQKIDRKDLKPGDLVFFSTRGMRVGHVGVYTGDGKFIHASNPRGGVKVDSLSSSYYGKRFVGARRVK